MSINQNIVLAQPENNYLPVTVYTNNALSMAYKIIQSIRNVVILVAMTLCAIVLRRFYQRAKIRLV